MLMQDRTRTINETYIDAPIERIWWYLSTPKGWNGYLSDIAFQSEAKDQFQEGDLIELVIGELSNHAVCVAVKEPFFISLQDHFKAIFPDGTEWAYKLRSSFSLKAVEHMVKVTVTVDGFTEDEMMQWVREGTEAGWRQSLFNLKCILELGIDVRNVIFGYPRLGVFNYTAAEDQVKRLGLCGVRGNYLKEVFPHGPAARSGLQKGDLITHINGRPVPTYYDLVKALSRNHKKKEPVKISYFRHASLCEAIVQLSYEDQFTGLVDPNTVSLQDVANERKRKAGAKKYMQPPHLE